MSEAKVSILIPCYNSEKYIDETLASCLAQTYENTEIIVVDDGSTDNSFAIVQRFESPKCKVVRQENAGACRARNHAFELCQGEFIQYLDADDLLAPNKIKVQLDALQRSGDVKAIALSRWVKFLQKIGDLPSEHGKWRAWASGLEAELALLTQEATMCTPNCYLTPRALVQQAGPWDERLKINQDGEFFARVLLQSSQVIYCPETEVYYRKGLAGSVSTGNLQKKQNSALLALRNIKTALLAVEDSPRSRAALAHAFTNFAYTCNLLVPELTREALQEIKVLGCRPSLDSPPKAALLSKLIGFGNFLALKRFLKGK